MYELMRRIILKFYFFNVKVLVEGKLQYIMINNEIYYYNIMLIRNIEEFKYEY